MAFYTKDFINILQKQHLALPVRDIRIEPNLGQQSQQLLNNLNPDANILLVCDGNTYKALGQRLESDLSNANTLILPNRIKADEEAVHNIQQQYSNANIIVAVGSGTINDICKRASYLMEMPYIVFGTAPSMNGYASANASITVNGYKKSLPAHLPEAIYMDTEIIAEAPMRLIQSGLGDSVCRSTAQADWLLSHLLLNTPYNNTAFALTEEYEKLVFESNAGLQTRDYQAVEALAALLIMSGLGMYFSGGSHPASQGEHLIAHYMEMMHPELPHTYHGEQIGVTTLSMARIQEKILSDRFTISATEINESEIISHFGKNIGEQCIAEINNKSISTEEAIEINRYLAENLPIMKKQLQEVMLPASTLQNILKSVNAPTTHAELGWPEDDYNTAIKNAYLLRNRFTFLDLQKT